jgi:hypothetical protein
LTRAQRADALAPQTRICLCGTTHAILGCFLHVLRYTCLYGSQSVGRPRGNALARAQYPSGGAHKRVNPKLGKTTDELM